MINVYIKSTDWELTNKKIEGYRKYNQIITWGRKHPTRFVERFLGIEFLDYQKYVFMNTWTSQWAVWLMSRNGGKSFLSVPYMMTRGILLPNQEIYIMSNTGDQAQATFMKLEKTAKKQITSLTGLTDVFMQEISKNAGEDGFSHNKSGFTVALHNGTKIRTLNGVAENVVGYRSNLTFYDEAGKISRHFFELTEPFTTQSSDFSLGGNVDTSIMPKRYYNQTIYASSAEDIESYLWDKYKLCSMKMIAGDKRYFVADVTCDTIIGAKFNGESYPPLLSREVVEDALKLNEEKALREYYNKFDTSGGSDAAVKRGVIIRNCENYIPVFENVDNKRKFVLCYDPALQADNAVVLIAEILYNEEKGFYAKVVNLVNLIHKLPDGTKKPIRTPEQIQWIKKLILDYNGNVPDYENILKFLIDPGAGGGGRSISTFLLDDWQDDLGRTHRGFADPEDESTIAELYKFPNAAQILRLPEPAKYKVKMYDALCEMMTQDLIKFPPELNLRGELEIQEIDEHGNVREKIIQLNGEEIRACVEIDLMKEELANIQKTKTTNGKVQYSLPPNKEKKMHDDRSYCLCMLGWYLSEIRRADILKKDNFKPSEVGKLIEKQKAKIVNTPKNPMQQRYNPFLNRSNNPWLKR